MKLLLITQVVDRTHPILGFFHRWLIEFSKHVDELHVIALQVGEYDLPSNVHVYSLGKDEGVGRFGYVWRFYKYIFTLKYDHVFVHMNPEYAALGGVFWRAMGKKIGLWYMHKSVDIKLRIAELLASHIFTATPFSFRLKSKKVVCYGHGIDTEVFGIDADVKRGDHLLSVGRLMEAKRHDLIIEASAKAKKKVHIIGRGEKKDSLVAFAKERGVDAVFIEDITHSELPEEYQKARVFVHTSETGSLDKVVLEALACGCPVITTNPHYKMLPVTVVDHTAEALAGAISSPSVQDENALHAYVRENHSLQSLIPKILKTY